MIVQKYYQEELTDLVHDQESIDEWKEIAERIGISSENSPKKAIPFMEANEKVLRIVQELCPSYEPYRKYHGTIPLEALKVIELCLKERYFCEINVHFDKESPDPFLVGGVGIWYFPSWSTGRLPKGLGDMEFETYEEAVHKGKEMGYEQDTPSSSITGYYLIAKWGDVKRTMEELRDMASESFLRRSQASIEKEIAEKNAELDQLKNEAILKFG